MTRFLTIALVALSMVIGVAKVGFLFAVAMSSKPEPGTGR
jgi:hypothetical protein